jgi:hypothetical protein
MIASWRIVDSPGLRFAGPPSLRLRVKRVKKESPLCEAERGDERSEVGVS